MSKITLIGCQAYYKNQNSDLFEYLNLPVGINKETLTDNILIKGSDFETLYADPIFIHDAIKTWSNVHYATFERWIKALTIEYNPLENYDRMEDWTDNRETTGTGESTSTGTSGSTAENKRSAFDSSTYQPNEEDTISGTATDTTTNETSGTDDATHSGRIHGNIGVTTSQQMLTQELDIGYWNIYERITEMFLRDFTLPVYV